MPFISIIVVTWNNGQHIEQALASCIESDYTDYEVIIVHNASTDDTGKLIRRAIAGHDNLFTVIENERNEGLGEARNIGMRHASGEYLMFLDGDDWYEPGVIGRLACLAQNKYPDVLIFSYQRTWDTGKKSRNKLTHLLKERDVTEREERESILKNFHSATNKLYKNTFIKDIDANFPNRFYEDTFWSHRNNY